MDSKEVSRSVFNTLDALGAAGGISGLIMSLSYMINSVLTYNKQENFLASQLYTAD